jgi:phospholipid-transporting ATPase
MEIVKLLQSYFIFYDKAIYDNELQKNSIARTSELIEELGQVEFVFSDKTGTLTQNVMEFKKCFVGGQFFGEKEDSKNLKLFTINNDSSAYNILKDEENSINLDLKNFFNVCTICHSSIAENVGNDHKYSSSSPDESALLYGAKNMGFVFSNRTSDSIEVFNSHTSQLEVWDVLVEIPFDSDRKRMTMIVKRRNDPNNIIYVFTKGADNVMLKLLSIDRKLKDSAIG